jgi:hypothetical protein
MGKSFCGIGPLSSLSAGGALCCGSWLWLFVDSLGVGVGAAEVAEVTVGGGGAMVVTAEGAPVVVVLLGSVAVGAKVDVVALVVAGVVLVGAGSVVTVVVGAAEVVLTVVAVGAAPVDVELGVGSSFVRDIVTEGTARPATARYVAVVFDMIESNCVMVCCVECAVNVQTAVARFDEAKFWLGLRPDDVLPSKRRMV